MSLSYIAPMIKEGEKIAQLHQTELDKGTEKWKKAIILYVVGAAPSIGVMERFIGTQWNFTPKPKIYLHNGGYFVVRFNSIGDRDEVLF